MDTTGDTSNRVRHARRLEIQYHPDAVAELIDEIAALVHSDDAPPALRACWITYTDQLRNR